MSRKNNRPDKAVIENAINDTQSMTAAAAFLGITLSTFKRYANHYGIYKPNQGLAGSSKLASAPTLLNRLEGMFNSTRRINGQRIKKLMINLGIKTDQCEICGQLPMHHGKKLVLQLDHLDGDHTNNNLSNLQIICPNCHSQTSTFCSRNTKNYKHRSLITAQKRF